MDGWLASIVDGLRSSADITLVHNDQTSKGAGIAKHCTIFIA